MWELPAKIPDNYVQTDKIKNPPLEHRLDEYPQISKKVWDVVIEVKDWVAHVILKPEKDSISWDAQEKTNELKESLERKVDVTLTTEEIEAIWWKIIAIFQWNQLIRYEIWDKYYIDVKNLDINNEFGNLLWKKVSNSYFERLASWEIIWHRMDWKILDQNNQLFHRGFNMEFWRLKEFFSK